ncbi:MULTISPECIES: chemotaxis protein [unclassified Colwellia]|uniref:chemotaxis protein n=1 Tax=unclassified Colwellia TaxID=196834 RepID=UPI0015F57C1C|nr:MULTISPECIES: chemotaxis protein [unclassified Colwellia]MBA6233376.1 chemotaxis protein CheV [Colwellia sp. MB02u-7]MBA6236466.1 chemotaxis protein CheV [Colwellia sp. MB02u-11]MBA6257000.1 chemotaxis protein CheV [Colwellia sp. MB3u-28]MBA6260995.1 chemotaxis protein CheV [Colwellia sp. MB3u-41]MBA6298135.1 chemotaxis protein CheV [Colwellia sp. MB3u-22]
MAGILDSVNQRTQLVGQNRLELLLFRLIGSQRFGINVFKVREVMPCPRLTLLPGQDSFIKGVAHIRGQTISVIDLSKSTGGPEIIPDENSFVIIAEYNRSVQGFLVGGVERIVTLSWKDIMPPPEGTGKSSYLTAVTEIDKKMVSILDVEKILNEISPISTELSEDVADATVGESLGERVIMIADDSTVARNQVKRALEPLGLNMLLAKNGQDALDQLLVLDAECKVSITEKVALLISDIEMPEMDGYTLTAEIKNNDRLKAMPVILHTSLSGVFNNAMVAKVGAEDFIPKFHPDELATAVKKWLKKDEIAKDVN